MQKSDLGSPNNECPHCRALHWSAEVVRCSSTNKNKYVLCCKKGRIKLPLLQAPPPFLDALLSSDKSQFFNHFKENIRLYNSMFAFSSMGGKIDYEIIKKPGPYIFRICGQNHHMIGSLLPIEGEIPKFSQLYIYDTENEFNNRVSFFDSASSNNINKLIVDGLMKMFDEFNVIAKSCRMVIDRFKETNFIPVKLKLM